MTPRLLPWGKFDYMGANPLHASLPRSENRPAAKLRIKSAFFPRIKHFNRITES
jgi:hypothetical protein